MIVDVFLDLVASLFGDGVRHRKWWLIVCSVVLVGAGAATGSFPILVTGTVVLIGSVIYAILNRGE